jgi:hypothetical protein
MPYGCIQQHRIADPSCVRDEEQRRDPVARPLHNDEAANRGQERKNDYESQRNRMKREHQRRLAEIECQLHIPKSHGKAPRLTLKCAPPGTRDEEIKSGPGRGEQQVGGREGWLDEVSVLAARQVRRSNQEAAAHDDREKRNELNVFLIHGVSLPSDTLKVADPVNATRPTSGHGPPT